MGRTLLVVCALLVHLGSSEVAMIKEIRLHQENEHNEEYATKSVESSITVPYWNMTTEQRSKFQQAQVDAFCQQYGKMGDIKRLNTLDRHILLHDQAKTAFCYAPKVGCTNLKVLFYLSQDALPKSVLVNIKNDILEKAIKKHSFHGLPIKMRQKVQQEYYKFIMYRNPVERLLSAYRSKIEIIPRGVGQYAELRKLIFQYKYPVEYRKWKARGGKENISISFSEFIDYWLFTDGLKNDEHFQTIFTLCQPCYIRYDYYGNFDTFAQDAEVLIEHIKSDSALLMNSYYKTAKQTSVIAPTYFNQLSTEQKKMIITKLAGDLSFYYAIFPSQKDRHKRIMSIDFDILQFD